MSKTEDWMKDEFHYELEDGFYYYLNGRVIIDKTEEVGIGFDTEGKIWLMLCHGKPEYVKERMGRLKMSALCTGNDEFANNLKVVSGKFPVDELNHLIHYSGYGKAFYERNVLRKDGND